MKRSLIFFLTSCILGLLTIYALKPKGEIKITSPENLSQIFIPEEIKKIFVDSVTTFNGTDSIKELKHVVQTTERNIYHPVDSSINVSYNQSSALREIYESFNDLSRYLDEINAVGFSEDETSAAIQKWASAQKNITNCFNNSQNNGVTLKYTNGVDAVILFVNDDIERAEDNISTDALQIATKSSSDEKPVVYHDIQSVEDETIISNPNLYCFWGMSEWVDVRSLREFENYSSAIANSPLSANACEDIKSIGNLNDLINAFSDYELLVISLTHGIGNGGFCISNSFLSDYSNDIIHPAYDLYFKNGALFKYKKNILSNEIVCINPSFFNYFPTGQGIGVMNYCWSYGLDSYIKESGLSSKNKTFASYGVKTDWKQNMYRTSAFLNHLYNGHTFTESIKYANNAHNDNNLRFIDNEQSNKRLFCIKHIESLADQKYDYYWIKYEINGGMNLGRKKISKIKLWYKDSPFEKPDETCLSDEFDISRIPTGRYYSYTPVQYFYIYPSGKNIGCCLSLLSIPYDKVYYTVGFEYESDTDKNIYYGEIREIEGAKAGPTDGFEIDLGLPSGTKWAAWNIGASCPEEEGLYVGWGEPTGEYKEEPFSHPDYVDTESKNEKIKAHYGGEPPLTDISGTKYDICRAKLGNGWCVPTKEQWEELLNEEYTYVIRYFHNGIEGRRIISKINGNSIFLPLYYNNDRYSWMSTYFTPYYWTSESYCETHDNNDGTYSHYYYAHHVMFNQNSDYFSSGSVDAKGINRYGKWCKVRACKK